MDDRLKQLLLLGREHYAKRELDKAEQVLREVLEHDDRFADVHDMLGVIAHSRGNFIAAERHFERALALNPQYTEAALNLAVTYNDRGKYEAAREVYARIKGRPSGALATLDPFARGKLANMHADLAQAYVDSGLPREAIAELEKAVALCPQFADLRTRLGTLLRETGDLPRARAEYEAAVAARPSYVIAHIQLGVTLLAVGEPDAAEASWKRALEIDGENPHAKMYLRMLAAQRAKGSLPPPAPAAPAS
jgi:Tfp pilus assembly protein PilF